MHSTLKKPLILLILCITTACTLPSFLDFLPFIEKSASAVEIDESISTTLVSTATAAPTPIPTVRIENADALLFAGELEKAIQEYMIVFDQTDDDELKANALLGVGRASFEGRDYAAAIDAFLRILGQYEQTKASVDAYFLLAQSYEKIGQYQLASDAYAQYLAFNPGIIDAYVLELQAATASAAGDHNGAILAYQNALKANPPSDATTINIKIGQEYSALADYTTAIQYFLSAYDSASNDYQRATANLLAGQAYLELELPDQAYERFLDSVIKYPKAYDAFTGLSILVSDGYPVDEFLRGLVDYYAGSYQYAIQAFERYLASGTEHDGTVHYFKGLCHFYRGELLQAIEEYDRLIESYPTNPLWKEAWEEKAFAYWNDPYDQFASADDYQNAVETRLDFVSRNPTSDYAPWFLYLTGRVLEYNDQLEEAAMVWLRLMDEYPGYSDSYRALFLAGISYYRLERHEEAQSIFQRCLLLAATGEERAKSSLWIGKTYQALGNPEKAIAAWQQAEVADPTDYYSIRASELINGKQPLDISAVFDLGYDLSREKDEAESWLRSTFNLTADIDLSGLAELAYDARMMRAQTFWDLGLYREASNELASLHKEISDNVVLTYILMNYYLSLRLYKPAFALCQSILNLAGLDHLSSLSVPIYFSHIRFGVYFREQIMSSTNEFKINPLILLSMIWRESSFEPFISSSAGAKGLMQIMPTTATDIVDRLKWPPDFKLKDLFLARVSIRFGANYLRQMIDLLNGDLIAALAAYNGGITYAYDWKEISKGDIDLFLEVIHKKETQIYIQDITELVNIYNLLYTRPQ